MLTSLSETDELARAFKALSHPNRLAIYLELLRYSETSIKHSCCLGDIIRHLDVGAPTISHHIKELVNAGLIQAERDGKFLRCRINRDMRDRLGAFFNASAT